MVAGALFCQARRMRIAALSIVFAFAAISAAPAFADVYRFDPVHSQIWFTADHQHFSHPQGRLRIKSGWFEFDEKDWTASRVVVEIDTASADMGDAKWSDMVRGGSFLDTERFPVARFVSKSIEKTGERAGVIHGELTLRGETRPVDVAFTLNRVGNDPYIFKQKAGFSAKAEIARSAFGMKRYADVVGENIELRFEIEGIRDGAAAKEAAEAESDAGKE
jgi:polyisoprenoid-binding protein YceI